MSRTTLRASLATLAFFMSTAGAGTVAFGADPAPAKPAATPTSVGTPAPAPPLAADPAKAVSYRHKVMKAMADHMAAQNLLAKGEVNRPGDMAMHATALHDLATTIPALYPAGTGPDVTKTEAKKEVWTQADKFAAAAKALETESAALLDVAKKGDLASYKAQLGKVGETCGNCHDAFAVEEEH